MNKRYYTTGLLSIALLFSLGDAVGQEQPSLRKRAEQQYERYEYAHAIDLYSKLADSKKPRTADFERLASSYMYLKNYELAENWYARAVQAKDHEAISLWHYGEVLKQNGKYVEAKEQYKKYAAQSGNSAAIELAIAGCDSAQLWMANPTSHRIVNEKEVNTSLNEFGLFPTSSGAAVYAGEPLTVFGKRSGMTGQAYLKIYSTERLSQEVSLTKPVMMLDVFNESAYHVGPISTNMAGDVLYITRTYPGSDTETHKELGHRAKRHNLELKIYTRQGDSWAEEDFAYNNVKEYSLGHASLSLDGQTLYYASNMPGGYGGVDIWYSELQADGSWGAPQNAGSEVNSAGDEMFPTILGEELYYSSNGFAGMGGLDIFCAYGAKSSFSGRHNLQFPINSAGDDFSYYVSEDNEEGIYGYLSSNRVGGVGGDDIYSFGFVKPKIQIRLEGLVYNKKTGDLIPGAGVTLYTAERQIVSRKVGGADGSFGFDLNKDTYYRVLANKEGYHADSVSIAGVNPLRDTVIQVALYLEPVFTVGDKFVLENIYYDFDKHNIRKDAAVILDELVRTMRDNPTLRIELSSHTDSRGSDSYNMKLSQRRADSAVEYLISRGIARDRLVAKGYGETRLVNKCSNGVACTIEEHQANRRTEVEVLEY
ncbi:OmpA family protein [Sphingobacterium sp. UT-1RO-CII-1]|uniref:OmpA family protein n=1 Tax=Sphingobacterium sp. UT-1RO-CII-1 TaxID=2995225 RepID=UPI00227BE96C|nr:OmpA family protein [Sphingobacterium sp. UT-1RO-CII-1]MCY4780545.1 OmpA family protein [Sphingobacterium sp. UT-1RO-CII-1]